LPAGAFIGEKSEHVKRYRYRHFFYSIGFVAVLDIGFDELRCRHHLLRVCYAAQKIIPTRRRCQQVCASALAPHRACTGNARARAGRRFGTCILFINSTFRHLYIHDKIISISGCRACSTCCTTRKASIYAAWRRMAPRMRDCRARLNVRAPGMLRSHAPYLLRCVQRRAARRKFFA